MHYKQNNKEIKTFVQGLRSFGSTLPRSVKGILKKNGYNYSEIISKWNYLVGKEIASYCYPKSIKFTKTNKNATLVLLVERGNEINIEYSKKEIINKINSYFGYELINEVRLQTFSSNNKKEERKNISNNSYEKFGKKINEIKNKDIKNSLTQLIKLIKND